MSNLLTLFYRQFDIAAKAGWLAFREEREAGIEAIKQLRQRVADEEIRKTTEQSKDQEAEPANDMNTDEVTPTATVTDMQNTDSTAELTMEVDDTSPLSEDRKEEQLGEGDDAVEY
jgi:hypothetical protein